MLTQVETLAGPWLLEAGLSLHEDSKQSVLECSVFGIVESFSVPVSERRLMPEVGIAIAVLLALGLEVRASWVWLFRGQSLVTPWRGTLGSVAISLVLLDCLRFILVFCRGEIGGIGTYYVTTRIVGWYFLASIVTTMSASLLNKESRSEAIVSGILTTGLWFGSGYVA